MQEYWGNLYENVDNRSNIKFKDQIDSSSGCNMV